MDLHTYRTVGNVRNRCRASQYTVLYCHHTVGQVCDGSLPNLVFVVLNSPMSKPQLNCREYLVIRSLSAKV
nr:MAG TPA: hypothetical protein [Caudoviricetes sp.]